MNKYLIFFVVFFMVFAPGVFAHGKESHVRIDGKRIENEAIFNITTQWRMPNFFYSNPLSVGQPHVFESLETGSKIEKTFEKSGSYTIEIDESLISFDVPPYSDYKKPDINFFVNGKAAKADVTVVVDRRDQVRIKATSGDKKMKYEWDFGDESGAVGAFVRHKFNIQDEWVIVNLKATDSNDLTQYQAILLQRGKLPWWQRIGAWL